MVKQVFLGIIPLLICISAIIVPTIAIEDSSSNSTFPDSMYANDTVPESSDIILNTTANFNQSPLHSKNTTIISESGSDTSHDARYSSNRHISPTSDKFTNYTAYVQETDCNSPESSGRKTGYRPHPLDLSHLTKKLDSSPSLMSLESVYPSFFDLRTEGRITPVKDQGSASSCWAFASYASLESELMPEQMWDFSENNMKNLLSSDYLDGFNREHDEGGNQFMAMAYLTRWDGPIMESDDIYSPTSGVSPTNLPVHKHVQNVIIIPARSDPLDNGDIKWALQTFGAVYSIMHIDTNYFNPSTNSYYYSGSREPNHAVTLVGWDDSYSRTLFSPVPQGDGAFIVKNSWGQDWGDGGYFYISYYDTQIAAENAVFSAEEIENYDQVYSYDPLGWIAGYGATGSDSASFANIFTAESDESLAAVSFYAAQSGSSYIVKIYLDPVSNPVSSQGPALTQSGILPHAGYYTIPLETTIPLNGGQRFSVIISITTPNYEFPVPIEYQKSDYSSQETANYGGGFVSPDGQSWQDITNDIADANVCIKAFTQYIRPPVANFSANQTLGTSPLTIQFTDLSLNNPESWYWEFGDGNCSEESAPIHCYYSPGLYTINLTVLNSVGSNTVTKTDYINVLPEKVTSNISLKRGWNLISLPLTNASISGPQTVLNTAYTYNATTQSYDMLGLTQMESKHGYWVASMDDSILSVEGYPLNTSTQTLSKGWNLIGSVWNKTSNDHIITTPPDSILTTFYRYDPDIMNYQTSVTIDPEYGYWIAAFGNCELNMVS